MNKRIAFGAALVFAIGSAAVGSTSNAPGSDVDFVGAQRVSTVSRADATPEQLASWKATAASSDYTPPRLPI
jgi:hypothetical protein